MFCDPGNVIPWCWTLLSQQAQKVYPPTTWVLLTAPMFYIWLRMHKLTWFGLHHALRRPLAQLRHDKIYSSGVLESCAIRQKLILTKYDYWFPKTMQLVDWNQLKLFVQRVLCLPPRYRCRPVLIGMRVVKITSDLCVQTRSPFLVQISWCHHGLWSILSGV